MSVIEAVTVVRYRVANPPKGWRRRGLRGTKALAYRDAAWAKIRARCKCTFPDFGPDGEDQRKVCRYHDKEYRAEHIPSRDHWSEPDGHGFVAPVEWGLPRREEPGLWDYGRAVAFRLARFYRHLDASQAPAAPRSTAPNATETDGDRRCAKPNGTAGATLPGGDHV